MTYLGKNGCVVYATPEIGHEVPYAGATLRNDKYPNRDGQSQAARYMDASFCQNGLLAAVDWGCTSACRSAASSPAALPAVQPYGWFLTGKALVVHAPSKFHALPP